MADEIKKIYDISSLGGDKVLKNLNEINKAFIEVKKSKLALENQKLTADDAAELAKVSKELKELTAQEKKLNIELKEQRIVAKELQITKQKEIAQQKELAKGNTALAGSYNDINKRYKELLNVAKNSTNLFNPQEVAQAQAELMKLKGTLDNFSRGLTKDGTLVGEYTSGILNAFKSSGLDNLITDQLAKSKNKVTDLDNEFEKLREELSQVRVTGKGSLEVLEKSLVENRVEASALQAQISRVEKEMKGFGGVGSQITKSLGDNFKNLKKEFAGFVLGYLSFQGALAAGRTIKDQTVQLDSLESSLRAVSGSEEEFIKNQEYLKELSDRLGVSLLTTSKAFKNFYASSTLAGISQDETRRIFESATEAASVLKLSQDDLNGVLLAFGQIASKGKVQAEELRGQIGERLPGAFAIAAKSLGVTQQALNKMLEKGEVLSSDFLPKFATELKKTFSLGGKEAVGLAATLARVETKITEFVKSNQEGFSKLINGLSAVIVGLLSFATILTSIPFPVLVAGIVAVTSALALYRAEQIRSYIVTQIATKTGLIYNAYLLAQTIITNAATYATKLLNLALKLTPWGIVITALTTIGVLLPLFASGMNKVVDGARRLQQQQEALKKSVNDLNKAMAEGVKNAAAEVSQLNQLYNVATNTTRSYQERKQAVDELKRLYPAYFGNIKDEIILNGQAESSYYAVRDAILSKARAEAGSQELTKRQGNRLKKEEEVLKEIEDANNKIRDMERDVQDKEYQGDKSSLDQKIEGEKTRKQILEKRLFDLRDFARKEDKILLDIVQSEKDKSNLLTGGETAIATTVAGKPKKEKQSTLSAQQKDYLKDLESLRDKELAINEEKYTKGEQSEEQYLIKIRDLNVKFYIAKMNYLKGANAEERKEIAETSLAKEKLERETNAKLFAIELKRIEDQKNLREIQIKNELNAIENNPALDDTDKIQAKVDADNKLIELQKEFNDDINGLELFYKLNSKKNAEERAEILKEVQKKLGTDLYDLQKAQFEKLLEAQKQNINTIQREVTRNVISILNDSSLSSAQKERKIKEEEKKGIKDANDLRIKQIEFEKTHFDQLLEHKLISQQEYNKKVIELENELLDAKKNTGYQDLDDQKKIEDLRELARQASEKLFFDFINNQTRIAQEKADKEYENALKYADVQKQQRLTQAQSEEEKLAIEEEYQQKQKEAERTRNEERKEIAKKQMAIEFAVATIKAISTSTTIYEGLIKEAVVLGEYLFALSTLNSQSFEQGGMVPTSSGGPINGPSHANGGVPFNYEAQGGELAIINKNSAQSNKQISVSGTPMQIASAINEIGGGVSFSHGAKVRKFEYGGSLGAKVQPPVFASYYSTGSNAYNSNEDSTILFAKTMDAVIAISNKVESLKVELNPTMVQDYNDAKQKSISIATL